ncbi:MAG: hypothetical protein NVS2B7_12120 [Herpetosiphon sp.]
MWRLLLLTCLLTFSSPITIDAQAPSVHVVRYSYALRVQNNGDVEVSEQQVIVVDQGPVKQAQLQRTTGSSGRVQQIRVAEDGQPYTLDPALKPATYTGDDNGSQLLVEYAFRDPTATRHTITITYLLTAVNRSVQGKSGLQVNLFCSGNTCPAVEQATVDVAFVSPPAPNSLTVRTSGFPVQRTTTSQGFRLAASRPVVGQQLALSFTFQPGTRTVAQAVPLRQANGNSGLTKAPAQRGSGLSPVLCVVILFLLIVVISIFRTRRRMSQPPGTPMPGDALGGDYRRRRRFGGFFPWFGGGYYDDGYYGPSYGPPTFPPPTNPPDGSGGQSWSDGGSGGQSWSDTAASGQSWVDSGSSGGSSWGGADSGGGSSWGDGGSSGGDSGGGGDGS